jgi:hypothetical protein
MTISLADFVAKYNGKPPVGGPPGLKGQCVALADLNAIEVYGDQEHEPFPENAIDIYGKRDAPGGYKWIKNDPANGAQVPRRGSMVIFAEDPNTGVGPLGHVDICLDPGTAGFNGLDQNWPIGAGPRMVWHPYTASIVGWGYPQNWDDQPGPVQPQNPPVVPPVEPPEDEASEPYLIFSFEVVPDDPPHRPITGAMRFTDALSGARAYVAAHPGSIVRVITEV